MRDKRCYELIPVSPEDILAVMITADSGRIQLPADGIDCIIFDLDGTILYTIDDIAASLNYALELAGLPVRSTEQVAARVGYGLHRLAIDTLKDISAESAEHHPTDLDVTTSQLLETITKHYQDYPIVYSRPYDGVREMLEACLRRRIPMAVLSNKEHDLVQPIVDQVFPAIFAVARGRQDAYPAKPDPASLMALLERRGWKASRVLYVGDSEVDIKTAAAAGTPFVGVSWGYRSSDQLLEAGATCIIECPEELLELITD